MPKQPVNTIIAPINVPPIHLVRLARFCDWSITTTPTARPHHFTLAADRIGQLAARGTTIEELLETVALVPHPTVDNAPSAVGYDM